MLTYLDESDKFIPYEIDMEQTLTPKQQAVDLINRAGSILVVSHRNPDGDSLGSMVALKITLEKLGKTVTMACSDKPGQIFSYLPKINEILTKIDVSKDLVITVDTRQAQVAKLGYKKNEKENRIEILITPEGGRFSEADVKSFVKGAKYDLVISLDTPNLERLGTLAEPADLFYEVPVVNIDHHPANERFGKVNWIELVATSTSEVLVSLIEALQKDKPLLDAEVATALLTGLIYDTSSFQNINTTPKSLTVAAQLVAAGGRQQEIVKNLYKTKSLETLKLWGIILQNVQENKQGRFIWSAVTKEEIRETGSDDSAIGGILDELLKSATDVDFAMLISERDDQVHGSLRSIAKGVNVSSIAELFGGGGHEVAAAFRIEGSLKDKLDMILSKIENFQNGVAEPAVEVKPKETPRPEPIIEKPAEIAPEVRVEESKTDLAEQISDVKFDTPAARDEKTEDKKPEVPETKPEVEPAKVETEIKTETIVEPVIDHKKPIEVPSDVFSFSAPIPSNREEKAAEKLAEVAPKEPISNGDSLTKW